MKKNTLLYLDENLVNLVKNKNLNISQIAEAALRSALYPGIQSPPDFEQYIKDMKKVGQCYTIPFKIKYVRLKNVGPIKEIELAFDTGLFEKGLNVIYGESGSGKSIVIKAIAYALGLFEHPLFSKESGKIELGLLPEESITISRGEQSIKCILLDDNFLIERDKFVRWLWCHKKYSKCQIIMTVNRVHPLCPGKVHRLPSNDSSFKEMIEIAERIKKSQASGED